MESERLGVILQHDSEYTFRSMMWDDNYWIFSDNREKFICMVDDIIEELLDLDMEPKRESLWWTSTHKHEDMRTLCVGGRAKVRDLPFCEIFDVLGYRFHRREGVSRRRVQYVQGIEELVT